VTADGTLTGWVGGACSEPAVIREALRSLADGEPRLLRIGPGGDPAGEPEDGIVPVESSCASEGVVEVFVEPQLPAPLLAAVGESPAADTLAKLVGVIGWRTARELDPQADAVLVATMGRGDEDALEAALASGAGYVALVASARRARTVLERLRARGLGEEELARVRSPAGLDLGPARQPEIAVAILAELVAWNHDRRGPAHAVAETVDPVCGMTLSVAGATESAWHEGVEYRFCSAGCRSSFQADPARYLHVVER
jgi:xanthine dehydrogenase accessory factor